MAKKKNTKSAERLPDILAIALCLVGAAGCLLSFWVDLNRSLLRYDEEPLGTVSWKHRAVQRRFVDRALWDRLRQDSPVYSGDYIRTEELSNASVNFVSSGIIEIAESSLIQIFAEDEIPLIRLQSGTLSVTAPTGDMMVESGESRVRLNSGGALRAQADDQTLLVSVEKGSALLSAAGEVREGFAGEGFSLSSAALESGPVDIPGALAEEAPEPPVLFSPGVDETILYPGKLPSVRFRWGAPEGVPPVHYLLELADNPAMENPAVSLQTQATTLSADVPGPGRWYWQLRPVYASGIPAVGTRSSFLVEPGTPPERRRFIPPPESSSLRATFPPDGYTVAAALLPDLRFTWKAPRGEAHFQVSDGEDFARLELDEQVFAKSRQIHRLADGTWYWRISARNQESAARRFTVASALAAPVPLGGAQRITAAGRGGATAFQWQPVAGADYYEFRIYEGESGGRLLHSETLSGVSTRVSLAGLADGPYRWTVQAFVNQTGDSTRLESRPASVPFELGVAAPVAAPRPAGPYTGPLSAPRLVSPANDFLFDAERLRGINGIAFSWAAAAGAESYEFTLFSSIGRELLSTRTGTPSYRLDNLSILGDGQFRWQVRALRRGGEERGPPAEHVFTVDVPELRRDQLEDIGTLYGR
jgi:hypothetical protein